MGTGIKRAIIAIIATIAAFAAAPAFAADLITKAPVLPTAYPATSGFYFGVGTMGGGGAANVDAPGVNTNALVTNQISANVLIGYVWNVPNSKLFTALEGWFGWQNFNGNTPGFSFTGPATFTQRVKLGAPLQDVAALFPSWGLTPPPFPPLPNGQTATNIKPYLEVHVTEEDVTLDVLGAGSNKDWRVAPGIGVGAIGQLTSGSVVDVGALVTFPQKGVCVGPGTIAGQPCGSLGTRYQAVLAIDW